MADGRNLRPRPQQEVGLQVQQSMSLALQQDFQAIFGRPFATFNDVLVHLSTLQPQERIDAVPQIREALERADTMISDAATALLNYVQQDKVLQRGVATSSGMLDWQELRRVSDRGKNHRKRVEEGRNRLAGLVGEPMLENCIVPLCRQSTTVHDQLQRLIRIHQGRTIKEILVNGCKHMILRLEKRTNYNTSEPHVTSRDLEDGNAHLHESSQVTQDRVRAVRPDWTCDEFGLIWPNGRPTEFLQGWNAPLPGRVEEVPATPVGKTAPAQQTTPTVSGFTAINTPLTLPLMPTTTSSAATPGSRAPSRVPIATPTASSVPARKDSLASIGQGDYSAWFPDIGSRSRERSVPGEPQKSKPTTPIHESIETEGVFPPQAFPPPTLGLRPNFMELLQGAVEGKKKEVAAQEKRAASQPPTGSEAKRRSRRSPTEDDIIMTGVATMFRYMSVVNQEAKTRAASAGQLKQDYIRKHPIPVGQPTQLENALWQLILNKVKAFKDGQRQVEMAEEDTALLERADPRLFRFAAQRIVDGINRAGFDDPSLAIYAQSTSDIVMLMLGQQIAQDSSMQQIQHLIDALTRAFGGGTRMTAVIPRFDEEEGTELTIEDFESLLLGRNRSGWLSGEAILAALRIDASSEVAEVINPNVWQGYIQSGHRQDMVPRLLGNAYTIIIPYSFPGHWALGIIDQRNRQLHFLDSKHNEERRERFRRDMIRFISWSSWYAGEQYNISTRRSAQQLNDYDCGVYVIENARAFLNHQQPPEIIGNAARLDVTQRMYDAVTRLAAMTIRSMTSTPAPGRNLSASQHRTPASVPSRGQTPVVRAESESRSNIQSSTSPLSSAPTRPVTPESFQHLAGPRF
ncbi:hypothetical protein GJ744_005635 [Endocarpon pusillum]|uniref:Ubiquitin-like protease family profile domain-containing protein n=1 Tax=Endocarpon pusillum TaxID=364733 RepID=A0A8H7A6Z3_9EURO|nr:hypothetical protein GJ744_005635 [Endocarpon pusillum]